MIKFTPEQQTAVDHILEQVEAGKGIGKNTIVSGQGGVGKTEMVTELVCILLQRNYKVAVSAMTGKATSVLRNKINAKIDAKGIRGTFPKENLLVDTIQKITKKSTVIGTGDSGETVYSNSWKDPENFDYDVLVIDELSMVPQYVSMWWQRTRAIVVGLGDFCQLPEVVTAESKKELAGFRHDLNLPEQHMINGYGIKVLKELSSCQLTKVLRSDNDIALLSNDLRDFTMGKRQVVEVIKGWAEKSPDIEYSTSRNDLETGDDWQIICYTNKLCREINNELCIGLDYPDAEDKVLLCDNINPLRLYNGDIMKYKDLVAKVASFRRNSKRKIFVCIKWQGKMPSPTSRYLQERQSFQAYVNYKKEMEIVNKFRMDSLEATMRAAHFTTNAIVDEYMVEINKIRKEFDDDGRAFIEVLRRLESEDLDMHRWVSERAMQAPMLYMVNLDYGYAITTHKSQGSEYEKVCYMLERVDKPLLYTGVSRAKKKLKVINLTKEV